MTRPLPVLLLTMTLAWPAAASAGPLRWGYQATDPNGVVLRTVTGLTDTTWTDAFLPDPAMNGTLVADPSPSEFHPREVMRSSASVTITDEITGETGELDVYADYVREYQFFDDGTRELIYEGLDPGSWSTATVRTLGDYTYSVTTPGGEFAVQVESALSVPEAVPEPAPAALALLGLAAVGVRRIRHG